MVALRNYGSAAASEAWARLASRLIDTRLEPGSHSFVWDGRDDTGRRVSSGVYLYTLKCESDDFTRRMVLLK